MTQYSYSRVSTFEQCPLKFKFHYIDNVEVEEYPNEDDPLLLGRCMDNGLEHGFQTALDIYNETIPYNSQKKEWELAKLEYWINRLGKHFKGGQFQIEIKNDWFLGYADWYKDGHLIDFKYASPKNAENYRNSAQLHLYYELMTQFGYDIQTMTYVVIPKTYIRVKKGESEKMFYNRLMETLDSLDPILIDVEYDSKYVEKFGRSINDITMANLHDNFPAKPSKLCDFCKYKELCSDKTINTK